MAVTPGAFDWVELMTTDKSAAETFYKSVIGWDTRPAPGPIDYALFTVADMPVAGTMKMPAEAPAGLPPFWHGYITVEDLDDTLARATSLGGHPIKPPMEVPGVGRFVAIADPQGAVVSLMQWAVASEGAAVPAMTPGHIGWKELATSDWEAAFAFYNTLFGWEKGFAMDMGAMGTYQVFSLNGQDLGGMMNRPAEMPVSAWGYYISVADIDAAAEKTKGGGGSLLSEPQEVPGGIYVARCRDPQGAFFAIVGPRVQEAV